jgi:hypothetical protein
MSRPANRKHAVEVSDHAWQRWLERVGRRPGTAQKLGRLIEKRLNDKIGPGITVYRGMEIRLDLDNGIEAVLKLSDKWIVITVIDVKREARA